MEILKLTKDELYLIERTADLQSSIASKNIVHISEQLLIFRCSSGLKKTETYSVCKDMMKILQEHHRVTDEWCAIRKKCEALRK